MKKEKLKKAGKRRYIFAALAFILGVIAGAVKAGSIDCKDIISALEQNISADNGQAACFSRAAWQNLKITGLFWIAGITVIGTFAAPFLIAVRGYAVGMSVGVLINHYGAKGILAAAAGVLPHSIVMVPAYIILAALAINFSQKLAENKKDIKSLLSKYTLAVALVFCAILAGCFIEGYVSLTLIKLTI